MIKKIKIIPILSILISALIFTGSITAIALEPPLEQDEKPIVFSYWKWGNWSSVNVFFGDDENIVERLLGDINNDGRIKAGDARLALRASAGLDILSAEDKVVADVNYDGRLTAADARAILLRASKRLEFFDTPFSIHPATINDYLRSEDFNIVTSVRIGSSNDIIPDMKEVDIAVLDYIIEVLKNNADVELYFGRRNYDVVISPYFGEMLDQELYPDKGIVCRTDMGSSGISFTIRKGADGSTWIGNLSSQVWAAKLENNKDTYDIIVEMAGE